MISSWLANADPATAWSHFPWSAFGAAEGRRPFMAVLPVHGLAEHGLGLPLDAEEVTGSAVLRRAVVALPEGVDCRVLPPLRFGLAPYPSCLFGIDPETAHEILHEIATSVQAAGASRLVFFNTSPWNAELIDAASVDARASLGLPAFVINLGGLGLDFHPASPTRAATQAVAARLLGIVPAPSSRPADTHDAGFRPGQYRQPTAVSPDPGLDGGALLHTTAQRLARILVEVAARPAPGAPASVGATSAEPRVVAEPEHESLWPANRIRHLAAMTRDQLETLPHKDSALVILPTGAIEQHGHHLPVGVDAILGQAWLHHTLPLLPADLPVYVAPPITYGKSNEHTAFPGTISLSARTLRRLVLAIVAQLRALGFRRLALLNTHGGNSAVLVYTLREIQDGIHFQAGLLGGYYRPDQDAQEAAYGFHAGEWETSLMLACAPSLVQMDRAVCEYPARLTDPGELHPEGSAAAVSWLTQDISVSGVMGDATRATPEKGVRWMTEACLALTMRIEELQGNH